MRAAVAVAAIPVPVGIPIGGNARADKGARGVHDPVTVTVLAVEGEGGTIALAQLDLIGLSTGLLEAVDVGVRAAAGGSAIEVVLCATHTHSAPDVLRGFGFDDHDYAAVDAWEAVASEIVIATVLRAAAGLEDAELRLGLGRVPGVAHNRRLLRADGSIRMNWTDAEGGAAERPAELVDEELTVVRIAGTGGTLGVVVHFALHPAVLVGLDGKISADWVHFLRERVRAVVGDVPVLFLNGAMGDVNHIGPGAVRRETGFAEAERVGRAIADVALAVLDGPGEALGGRPELVRRRYRLRQRVPAPEDLAAAAALVEAAGGVQADALDGIPPLAYAHWTVRRGVALAEELEVDAAVLRLGRLALVLLPFEVFTRFGLELRRTTPHLVAKLVSLGAGPYFGYLPTAEAFDQGGYEPTLGTSTIARGEGEALLAAVAAELDALEDRPLRGDEKSCQPGWSGLSSRTLRGRRLKLAELRTPQLLLEGAALRHNLDAMANWARVRGALLAPHGKTTMAPQLWRRQLDRGGWGITVTTRQQAEVAVTAGVPAVQLAMPVAEATFADWIVASSSAADRRGTRFLCWVDSVVVVELLGAAVRRAPGARPLDVLVELGHDGGRTGARGGAAALRLAEAIVAEPGLALRGIAGYEGTAAHGGDAASLDAVDGFLRELAEAAAAVGGMIDGDTLVSVGGSAYFDRVVAILGACPGLRLMLRSGGYVTHDEGYYAGVTPSVRAAGPALRPAITVWTRIVSVPEPGLALIDAGRRDLPYDEGLPVPKLHLHDGRPVALEECELVALNDQHGFVRFPAGLGLRVGELLGLGISHPCAALDRWGALPVVASDADGTIEMEELLWTHFG
ncbi:alanine racemase [Agromyces soli]|uniref:Alanine racemase n=1 Tax=Agromyces soli TaxID=659012 RepID=A0ABY4AZH9_9MICO|nr:alanine racemase [Agromyces soli]UOE27171.1 alanine racemase [Agromyces soli]